MQVRACKYEARVQVAACFCNDLLRLVIGFELAKGKDTGQSSRLMFLSARSVPEQVSVCIDVSRQCVRISDMVHQSEVWFSQRPADPRRQ